MKKAFTQLGIFIVLLISASLTGLLLAFPVKWAWNYAVVSTFGLPMITWGKAWCFNFLAGMFIQSTFTHNSSN